jgi:hypothetical protein
MANRFSRAPRNPGLHTSFGRTFAHEIATYSAGPNEIEEHCIDLYREAGRFEKEQEDGGDEYANPAQLGQSVLEVSEALADKLKENWQEYENEGERTAAE